MSIQDSGARREFSTGAVRDIADGKGRCDLLPLGVISRIIGSPILHAVNAFVVTGENEHLRDAIKLFSSVAYTDVVSAMLDVSKHYEEGCIKYGERNWEKGIPLHCFIDSAVRHYFKFERGDTDERHDRAVLWNLMGALWTKRNRPEMIDLPFAESIQDSGDKLAGGIQK